MERGVVQNDIFFFFFFSPAGFTCKAEMDLLDV